MIIIGSFGLGFVLSGSITFILLPLIAAKRAFRSSIMPD